MQVHIPSAKSSYTPLCLSGTLLRLQSLDTHHPHFSGCFLEFQPLTVWLLQLSKTRACHSAKPKGKRKSEKFIPVQSLLHILIPVHNLPTLVFRVLKLSFLFFFFKNLRKVYYPGDIWIVKIRSRLTEQSRGELLGPWWLQKGLGKS